MGSLSHTSEDAAVVQSQLGRPVRGRWGVARRCHLGVPMVIENHPRLDDGSPFPTLYWLTCPLLVKRASRLESGGYMQVLTRRLATDDAFGARLEAAVADYRARRDRHEVLGPDVATPGGGPERVKCLHAHLAHHLVNGDPVGALTLAAAGWPDCIAPCVEPKHS